MALWLLALTWALIPMAPAWWAGAIPGSPWTDLYPSVWGLQWFVEHASELLPTFAPELAAPAGMPFYYSSPLHGWLAVVTTPLMGLVSSYTLGVAMARVATVVLAGWAAAGLGLGRAGSLTFAAVYGCAPFFHGYTVEGIIEGTDGWTLVLWVGLAARERWGWATMAAWLTVASSWYLAMVGVLLAALVAPWRWRASASVAVGLLAATPLLWAFGSAFSGGEPLPDAVRAAMGTQVTVLPRPGLLAGDNPFAKTSWVGWITPLLALLAVRRRPWIAAGVLVLWLLSLGVGPIYELPVWRSVRFPYRLHAGTLLGLGLLAGHTVDRLTLERGWLALLAPLIVVEGWLLSPVEPWVPLASAEIPAVYRHVNAGELVLAVPGPLALPPGQLNPSRPRARYLLYALGQRDAHTPWTFDFNAVTTPADEPPVLASVRSWDRYARTKRREVELAQLQDLGVDWLVVHERHLGRQASRQLLQHLTEQGATLKEEKEDVSLLRISDPTP